MLLIIPTPAFWGKPCLPFFFFGHQPKCSLAHGPPVWTFREKADIPPPLTNYKEQHTSFFNQQPLRQLWLGTHNAATLKKISQLSSGDTHNNKKHAQPVREAGYTRDTDETTPTHQTRSESKGKLLRTAAIVSHLPGEEMNILMNLFAIANDFFSQHIPSFISQIWNQTHFIWENLCCQHFVKLDGSL